MKYLKDKRIEILALDEWTEEYTVVATVWAHFRSMSIKEVFNAGADYSWNNVIFTITKPVDFELNTYCEIRYNNNDYVIEAIDVYEDRPGSDVRIHARCRY